MSLTFNSLGTIRARLWKVALLGGGVAYLGCHLIQGNRGLLALFKIREIVQQEQTTLNELEFKHATLTHHVKLLRPQNLDLDLLDERAREVLNEAQPDEIVLDVEEILENSSQIPQHS